ncbi:hypothetical protein [Candidatus Phycosocius spiralis]|uniref:DUF998 domain-containing protein n=1 Tax=Candidatus Phycosocius spiralis TaxID=2815099 RepID=A0ABQ4PUS8_9PROT|nr:hypothetical protein [Candidatus Phycosocius spiralis]GIU66468.1 hypothetical protein PsB1_0622 [Candidatus Phycosocius spiralis]
MSEIKRAKRFNESSLFFLGLIGLLVIFGASIGYLTGKWVKQAGQAGDSPFLSDVSFSTGLSIGLGFVLLGTYIISATLYGLALMHKGVAGSRVLTGGLGGNPSSRKAYPYLILFYLGYSAAFGVLTVLEIGAHHSPANAPLFVGAASIGVAAMVWSALRLWSILDEFFRAIWVEACALSSFILLLIALIGLVANKLELIPALSGYSWLVLYQWVYLITNGWVAFKRDPNILSLREHADT